MQTHFDAVFSFTQLLQIESLYCKSRASRYLYQGSIIALLLPIRQHSSFLFLVFRVAKLNPVYFDRCYETLIETTPIFIRFPDPRQPSKPCSVITFNARGYRSKSVESIIHGNVCCHDYQTVEAIWARLLPLQQQRQLRSLSSSLLEKQQQGHQLKVAKLLFASFQLASQPAFSTIIIDGKDQKPSMDVIVVIDIGLKDDYICRACRLSSLSWSRRMWALASKANMISFTSVWYSVLGGAYSSLSKANANYAYKAGSLAIQQIKFAQWLKDPILESKCWLYYAEDLIQLHRFKRVDKILAKQVVFAQNLADPILLKMCDSLQTRRDRAYADHVHHAA